MKLLRSQITPRPATSRPGPTSFRRLGLAGLATALAFSSSAATSAAWQEEVTPEQVLERHVRAIGGPEALAKCKNRRSRGTVLSTSLDNKSLLNIWETSTGERLWQARSEGLGEVLIGTTEDCAWAWSLMEGPWIYQGPDRMRALQEAPLGAAAAWKQRLTNLEYLGQKQVDETDCHVLRVTPKGARPELRYYSQASGLHYRTETMLVLTGTPLPAVITYGDYRKVDGVLVPHAIHTAYADFEEQYVKLEKVEHNLKLSKSRFVPPQEIRDLRESE